jgi:hypothetical protein
LAGRARQSGSTRSAASIARRVSAGPMFGICASPSPVAGFVTEMVSPESASTHAPSIQVCVLRRSARASAGAAEIVSVMTPSVLVGGALSAYVARCMDIARSLFAASSAATLYASASVG